MMKRTLMVSALAIVLSLSAGFTLAADQASAQKKSGTQEQLYGSQLMTQQERTEQRAKIRAAKTIEERERIRMEHHERMKQRAKERGAILPEEPPARGGMGGGMGAGGGMGSGGGRGR